MPRAYLVLVVGLLIAATLAHGQTVLGTFSVAEHYGVSHPDQIIDFDLEKPVDAKAWRLLDAAGQEVTYQLVSGGKRLAVRTDLKPGESKTWRLAKGKPGPPPADAVKVAATPDWWEITNGLTGVRIPVPPAGLNPLPAPVQGVRLRDGTWSGTGPNPLTGTFTEVQKMTVRFLEKGPLKVLVEVAYQFSRKELRANSDNSVLVPAGPGFYRYTIEVQAGQPSLLFVIDTDTDVSWSLNLYPGLEPTQARYRGHHATASQYGREPDGSVYRGSYTGAGKDATVDLDYSRPRAACYAAGPDTYRYMAVWDPWVFDSGWYWQFFRADAPDTANLAGIFAGPPSLALGAAASGVGLFTNPEPRRAGITVDVKRLAADARWFPRVRFGWGLFVGTKGGDLPPPDQIQSVNRQMNLHSGLNLNKVHRYQVSFPDPPGGFGALYLPRATVERTVQRLREDRAFLDWAWNAEPGSRTLIDLLCDASGEKARAAAREVLEFGRFMVDTCVNREGIYHPHYCYWQAGQAMAEKALWLDCLLGYAALTDEERRGLKAVAVAFGNVLWDDDFVPLFVEHGLNLAQGPIQYQGFRSLFALYLAQQAAFRERAGGVEKATLDSLPGIINEHGAGVACTHYMPPYVASSLNAFMQLQQVGKDHFRTEPRLAKFAEFYMNFLTPPEPRFGGQRKYIATSDSSSESSELYGVLAAALRPSHPELSARLQGAWLAGSRRLDPRFGSCLLRLDPEGPAADPQLSSASFPGYYSVLRYGWGTPNETALWLIDGEFYREHRHPDQGMAVIYALGAPVSVHWSSLYYPQVSGAFQNSSVLLEEMIGCRWDQDSPPLNAGGGWTGSTSESFLSFSRSAYTRAAYRRGGTTWTREAAVIHLREDRPVVLLRDRLSGEKAEQPAVLTLPLMAQGPVGTPQGEYVPTLRADRDKQLPSAGPVFEVGPGPTRLGFTGQHLADWDVYLVAAQPQQALVGNWAGNWHQEVQPFEERQHLLRVRGVGGFTTLLLPYRKGQSVTGRSVSAEGEVLRIREGEEETALGPGWLGARQGEAALLLASLDAATHEWRGLSVTGGPAEVTIRGDAATVVAHGPAGPRVVRLPGTWRPAPGSEGPVKADGGGWRLDYAGGAARTVSFTR